MQKELNRVSKNNAAIEAKLDENEQSIERTENETGKLKIENFAKEQQQEELAKQMEIFKTTDRSISKKVGLTALAAEGRGVAGLMGC